MNDFDAKLDELIDRLRSCESSKEEIAEMETLLANDPVLRKRFRSRMRLESYLLSAFQSHQEETLPFETEPATWTPPRLLITATAVIAACLLLTGLVTFLFLNPTRPVAVIESESDAAWEGSMNITGGSKLGPGMLRLQAGIANIRFKSGALVMLEAPAALHIQSAMKSELLSGKALVEAPESAHGFVVVTPHGYVTDLGTRFSVSVDESESTCEVLDGEISLHHVETGNVEHLHDQQASTLSDKGINKLDLLPSANIRPPEVKTILLGTKGIETSIVRSNQRERFLHPGMLMVKHSYSWTHQIPGEADRRAIFTIGLPEISPSQIAKAKLRLNLVPSGLGFAAYLPEMVRFSVYGISDEAKENWATEDLLWEDAPGLDSSEVTLLGTFEISRGKQRGAIVFSSNELTEFVKSDTSRKVSFIITRETKGIKNHSLVHAFASNQHHEANGPTLEIFPFD
ncbi:MAG: FecR family protein [Verrucomicrobiales bacterium]|nr:FecR family protein [Verrucomicrobiales bacterium]